MFTPPPLYPIVYQDLIHRALQEDLGRAGDLTTDATVQVEALATGEIRSRKEGRIAGLHAALFAFQVLDPTVTLEILTPDGSDVAAGGTVARIEGRARALLSAERTALNLLGRLCGIATTTRSMVRAVAKTEAKIVCTRKTTPLLRTLEKYAVRCGGGANHRFGLDDAILIKDNHRLLAGGAAAAVRKARDYAGHLVKIEVEIEDLADLERVLKLGVDVVLLDNMSLGELRQAVAIVGGRAITEASGGITPETAPEIAATGVDLLSVGWLTHSAPVLDLGLDFAV
jgi:nicotinate-nucleotide pyrophosphorylase (carboxylating)